MTIISKSANETRVNFQCSRCYCEYSEADYKTIKVVNTPFYKLHKTACPECGKLNLNNNVINGLTSLNCKQVDKNLTIESTITFSCTGCGIVEQAKISDCIMRKINGDLVAIHKCEHCESVTQTRVNE